MKYDYKVGQPCPFSTLCCGEIFSYEGELWIKTNTSRVTSLIGNAVALRNGNLIPFDNDPIVVWEDAEVKKRRRRNK